MGAYKFWNPATQQYEIIKSKSIIKEDGSLEYTPDDVKAIDDEISSHSSSKSNPHGVTKAQVNLGNVDNVKQFPNAGGTLTGIGEAHSNTSYTVRQMRNIILSTSDAVLGSMQDGEIWIKYV